MFEQIRRTIALIPSGKVATYGQIASLAGYPGAARQVAWALHNSSGLPWHRVLGSGGKILLSGHSGMEQRLRLQMEGVILHGMRVDLKLYGWQPGKLARPRKSHPRNRS
jgi:methylated-DNA-protein-cysteine methyltransferase-like protein